MSEAKFTKGKWYVAKEAGVVMSTHEKTEICEYHPTGDYEFEANASLIAAAPEMYAELQEVSNWLNSQLGFGGWHKDIEKLLKKARGEA